MAFGLKGIVFICNCSVPLGNLLHTGAPGSPEEGFYGSRETCLSPMQGPVPEAARYLIPMKGEASESPSGLPFSELPYLPPHRGSGMAVAEIKSLIAADFLE